ncbi:MAG: cytidylate kinase-like family protein [Anaerolineae bacterium]
MAIVTVSRQYGSGGRKIALRVAELLGYQVFDKRLIMELAADIGFYGSEVIDFSEDHYKYKTIMGRLNQIFGVTPSGSVPIASAVPGVEEIEKRAVDQFGETAVVMLVNATLHAAHDRGNVVIVGRGGQVVLKDKPDTFHVRVEAPPETRLARLEKIENLTPQVARRLMDERDKAGAQYMERHFRARWDDPMLYHLVINTGKMDTERAARLIAHAVEQMSQQVTA